MTFRDMYRTLREYVPNLSLLLAQRLINERYAAALDRRAWSALRTEATFDIAAPISTGTVSATQGSATLTFSGAGLTSAVVGRQIKVNNQAPILTITALDVGLQTATVTPAWPLANTSGTVYTIANYYVSPPDDFKAFVTIVDPVRQWQLRANVTAAEINAWDAARVNVGDPWVVADLRFSDARPQYELWPGPSTQRGYLYVYQRQGAQLLEDDDEPIYPFRGTELIKGALADLTKWPGTPSSPNPLFENAAALYPIYQRDWEEQLGQLERQDDNIYLSSWTLGYYGNLPYAPMDSRWMQTHAFPATYS